MISSWRKAPPGVLQVEVGQRVNELIPATVLIWIKQIFSG